MPKTLGQFEPIEGTNFLMAPIQLESDDEFEYTFSLYVRTGLFGTIHNYIFLDRASATVQQLLPTNDYVIISTKPLVSPLSQTEPPLQLGWLYVIVKADTNGDGKLSLSDQITLAISDVGGSDYSELLADVEELYGYALRDETSLLLVYRTGDRKYLAIIDLAGRTVVTNTELPSFGADVK